MENYYYTPRCKITVIPLGLILTEKHDDLILYDVCHDYISIAWGHGLYYGGSVLVAMPQLSDLVALPHISVLVVLPRLSVSGDSVTLSVLAAMLHISMACSSWVGRVVSPHGERLVWECIWFDMGWVLHKHAISVLICYGPMGYILTSVLG